LEDLRDRFPKLLDRLASVSAVEDHIISKTRLLLQINFLLMELNLGQTDTCRLICQRYLRLTPRSPELWIMYAWIEEVAGNNSDAELIFSKFIYRYPGQYACWHAYALSALAFKVLDRAFSSFFLRSLICISLPLR